MKRLIESELLKMQTIWARWGTKWLKYLWILIWRVAHFPSHSFRGSVCKCSHCTVIFLWNLVLLCPHTSPDPQLAVDMGLTRCRNSYGSSKVRDCMDQGMHGWISCWVKWVHLGKQNVFYLCPDYWLVPIEPITCCDVLNSTQKLTLPVLPIPEVDDSIPS